MIRCEYCNRGAYLNDTETCNGCGAPLSEPRAAMIYDPQVFADPKLLGRPGVNVPLNLNRVDLMVDYIRSSVRPIAEAYFQK